MPASSGRYSLLLLPFQSFLGLPCLSFDLCKCLLCSVVWLFLVGVWQYNIGTLLHKHAVAFQLLQLLGMTCPLDLHAHMVGLRISMLTALSCLAMHCFDMSVCPHPSMMCPLESSQGQTGHMLCGTIFSVRGCLLLPSEPVLHLYHTDSIQLLHAFSDVWHVLEGMAVFVVYMRLLFFMPCEI